MKKVFLTYAYNEKESSYVSLIKNLLASRGVRVYEASSLEEEYDIVSALHYSINKCDLLIAFMIGNNLNIAYEIGYAIGKGKEVLIICDKYSEIPFDLKTVPTVILRDYFDTSCDILNFVDNLDSKKEHRNIDSEKTVQPLIDALKDEDIRVRSSAAAALGKIKSEQAVKPLIDALTDVDGFLRSSAAIALGNIKSEKAVQPLIQALKDENYSVRGNAATALGNIKSEKAVQPLIDALKNEDIGVRSSVAEALGKIKSEKAVQPLIHALKDENYSVRSHAAEALGIIKSEEAVQPLIDVLKDEDVFVRNSAAEALENIKLEKTLQPLLNLMKYDYGLVQSSIEEALGSNESKTEDSNDIEIKYKQLMQSCFEEPNKLDQIEPKEFENLIFDWLMVKGFNVIKADKGDVGYDFLISNYCGFNKTLVEVKKYNINNKVSVGMLQKFLGALNFHKADYGILISSSGYTKSAVDFSENAVPKIELWDMESISKNVEQRTNISTHIKKIDEVLNKVKDLKEKIDNVLVSLSPGINEEVEISVGVDFLGTGAKRIITIPLQEISYFELKEDLKIITETKNDKLSRMPERLVNKIKEYLLRHGDNDMLEKLT